MVVPSDDYDYDMTVLCDHVFSICWNAILL